MTIPSNVDVVVAPVAVTEQGGGYVDWPAIIAGIAIASALSLLFLSFGSAIGLSLVNFRAGPDVPIVWIAIAAASWLLWVQISSFMAGAYVTGRMRRRHHDASEEESDVRDGVHGLLVWAGALVIGGLIAVGGISAAATAVGAAASSLTSAATTDKAGTSPLDANAYLVDAMFRPGPNVTATTADPTAVRDEAGRILLQGAINGVSEPDRAYLAQMVAQNAGVTPEEASSRVTAATTAIDNAKAEAAAAAETARKTGVLGAFLTAASLLISAAGAFWAAQMGGNHRDERVSFGPSFRRRQRQEI